MQILGWPTRLLPWTWKRHSIHHSHRAEDGIRVGCIHLFILLSGAAVGWSNLLVSCDGGKGEDVLERWRNLPFLALELLGVDLEGEVSSANEDSGRINGGGSRRQR